MKLTQEEYNKNPKHCLNCNKLLRFNQRGGKFCSSSCAATYNNKHRNYSEEFKQKVSKSLKKYYNTHDIWNKNKNIVYKYINGIKYKEKQCCICNKMFLCKYNSSVKTCSHDCHIILKRNIGKAVVQKRMQEGTFVGWKTRNISSYAEKFFMNVLNNNNIKYQREFVYKTHETRYFLDFYIEHNNKKIDLEIDGKQHKYPERIEMDKIRDKNITSDGVIVYRIEWNEINTENGKCKIENKINQFLKFYNEL